MATSSSATSYYVTVTGTGTDGSVKGKATAGSTTGIVAANATNTSSASTITPTITGSGGKVYIKAAAITASSSDATATTTVAPGDVTIVNNETAVSGKTRIGVSPSTETSGISTYYIALKANAAANSTGTTSAISGTASANVSTAGYAPATLTGSGSVSGNATAKTSSKDSSVYYLPITSAVGSVTLSTSLTKKPAISRTEKPSADTWTDAASGASTTTKPTSGVYV